MSKRDIVDTVYRKTISKWMNRHSKTSSSIPYCCSLTKQVLCESIFCPFLPLFHLFSILDRASEKGIKNQMSTFYFRCSSGVSRFLNSWQKNTKLKLISWKRSVKNMNVFFFNLFFNWMKESIIHDNTI